MDSLLDILIILIIVISFCQRDPYHATVGTNFAMLICAHDLLCSALKLEGLAYYGLAAVFDLAFIVTTISFRDSKMLDSLYNICLTSIVLNFFGWILWFVFVSPIVYDISFLCLYIWAVVVLLKRDDYVGGFGVGRTGTNFHFNIFARRIGIN